MLGLDTNILLGWLIEDCETKLPQADAYFISLVVLAEFSWIYRRVMSGTKMDLVVALETILQRPSFHFANRSAIEAALNDYSSGKADFADYLLLHDSLANGAAAVLTLDRDAARHPSFLLAKGR